MRPHHRLALLIGYLLSFALTISSCVFSANPQGLAAQAPAQEDIQSAQGTSAARQQDTTGTSATPATSSEPTGLPETFSGQAAYRHVEQLAKGIGSRPTGTDAERAAAAYIAAQLTSFGYRVEQQAFEFESYQDRGSSLEVMGLSATTFSTNALYFSPGGSVTGALVAVGIGRPEDFPAGSLAGRIALIERGTLTFMDKVANAAKAGAVAVIVYNNADGQFRGNLGRLAGVPAVSITREDGLRLVGLLSQGPVQVRVQVDAGQQTVKSSNVIARAGESCRVIVGGHYDSVPAGPGANDNGSGTATTIELARVLRGQAKSQDLCFVAFGGEELGLWGSRRFVEALTPMEKGNIRAMINLDMVGVGDQWRISGSESLRGLVSQGAQGLGIGVQTSPEGSRTSGGSDHASFLQANIPAVFFYRSEDPHYHTAEDKAEYVDPSALEAAGRMAVEVIDQLAGVR